MTEENRCPTCGCPGCEDHSLEGHLRIALRTAAQHRMSIFAQALEEHRRHRGFRAQGWAYSLELGFTCDCVGYDQEWRITIRQLRELEIESRVSFHRFLQGDFLRRGDKLRKRKARKASIRARALLFRHLTRKQKWQLRADKSFCVVGKDGLTYRITEGPTNNVFMLDEKGRAIYSLCVVADHKALDSLSLPVYDLMLLQKVYLEHDTDTFIRTAVARDLETREIFQGGTLLGELDNSTGRIGVPAPLLNLSTEELDNPEPWVRARLQEAEAEHAAVQAESNERDPTLVSETG